MREPFWAGYVFLLANVPVSHSWTCYMIGRYKPSLQFLVCNWLPITSLKRHAPCVSGASKEPRGPRKRRCLFGDKDAKVKFSGWEREDVSFELIAPAVDNRGGSGFGISDGSDVVALRLCVIVKLRSQNQPEVRQISGFSIARRVATARHRLWSRTRR